jgi:hypothetical protein
MGTTPSVAIGVIPRERFNVAAEAVRRIVKHTSVPYRLVIIDCNMPERYRSEVEHALPASAPVDVLRFDRYLLPNESRNHVVAAAQHEDKQSNEFVCLIDNDVFVEPGWLERLLAACEEESAGVARPAVLKFGKVHFDCRLGPVSFVLGSPGHRPRIGGWTRTSEFHPDQGRRRVEWLEMHCLLFRTSVFSTIGPLDGTLNTREHVDLSLALRAKNVPIVFEPSSRVHFMPPPPVRTDERPFFFFRWDTTRAVASNARVKTKWNLVHYRSNIDWVFSRQSRVNRVHHFVNELWERLSVVRSLRGQIGRVVNERRKQWGRSIAQRKSGNLPGLEAGPLRIPIRDEDTQYIRAGSVTFGVERRLPRHSDPGVSLHVFTEDDRGRLLERFRADCLHESPHYHYIFQDQGINQKFWIDPLAVEDMQAWVLDLIRRQLPQIFATVGGADTAALADMAQIERVLPEVASAMRKATDWMTDFGGT